MNLFRKYMAPAGDAGEGETPNLRDTLEQAFDASEEQAGRPSTDAAQPVRPAAETPAAKPAEAKPRADGRNELGRFARSADKAAADAAAGAPAAKPAVDAASGAPAGEAQKPTVADKAPASWKPGAREAWSHLPPDVREEIHRREVETARTMQQTSQARQVMQTIQQLQQEFAPALQAEGVDALTASRNLMQISSRMRFGTPIEKAMTVAQIMQAYGVDVPTLDAILSNSPMPQQSQMQQQQLRDPRVDGLLSELAAARQQQANSVREEAAGEVEKFGAGKDFFNDVRETMADMMEVAAKRGIDMTLDQAYERACQLDPEISRVLAQRAAAGQAQNQNRSTARAKAAASSVRSTPASGGVAPGPENLRGAIEAAWDSTAG